MIIKHDFNFHELKASDRLPSPSGTALAIMKLVGREDASINDIAKLVQTDPALSGRIIAFANSSVFAIRRPSIDIKEAILRVGFNAVKNFTLTLSLLSDHKEGSCKNFDYNAFWGKSLLMAISISDIMMRDRIISPEEAFTLGLLSEIGRLAIATVWPELYNECLELPTDIKLMAKEQELFAVDHDALTLLLLNDWGLPQIFIDALNQSRLGVKADEQATRMIKLARQIIFANQVVEFCLAGEISQQAMLANIKQSAELHGITSERFLEFVDDVLSKWKEWGDIIGISTEIPPDQDAENSVDAAKEAEFSALDILVVDDDPMVIMTLSRFLAKMGHRVQACRNGEEALKLVVEKNFQLVFTDWHMEPVDGLELCKTLRKMAFGRKLYIIMLTASESEESLIEAFESGIDDYVIKPINFRVLNARMHAGQRIVSLQEQLAFERQELEKAAYDLVISNRRLQHTANTDMLTGLPNRRYAMTRIKQEWEEAQRYNRPISVLMLDLDYFKSINDTLGHHAGDQTLVHTTSLILQNIRASDVACRIGGEEFCIIAPNTDQAGGLLLAERIRKAVETNQIKDLALSRKVTISIGVSATVGNKKGYEELLKLADQALYQVKNSTRNAVRFA